MTTMMMMRFAASCSSLHVLQRRFASLSLRSYAGALLLLLPSSSSSLLLMLLLLLLPCLLACLPGCCCCCCRVCWRRCQLRSLLLLLPPPLLSLLGCVHAAHVRSPHSSVQLLSRRSYKTAVARLFGRSFVLSPRSVHSSLIVCTLCLCSLPFVR